MNANLSKALDRFDEREREEQAREERRKREDREKRIAQMAPAGSLGLPELLEARRIEHLIPDRVFDRMALFDRVFIWQINPWGQEDTYAGTSIAKPQAADRREKEEAPMGVLTSIGLKAMDTLHAYGVGLGDIVEFLHLTPWRLPVNSVHGQLEYLIPLRVGDLCASMDAAARVRSGEARYVRDEATGQHRLVGAALPQLPKMAQES